MTFSISYFSKFILALAIFLGNWGGITPAWGTPDAGSGAAPSEPLRILDLHGDRRSPQAAQTVPILWTARASGGVGEKTYEFELLPEGGIERPVQAGPSPQWSWVPQEAGRYRIRVTVRDALETRVQSPWSAPFEVAPPLAIEELAPREERTQFLVGSDMAWEVRASGGIGERAFTFFLEREGREPIVVQKGSSPRWEWKLQDVGTYRVKVICRDSVGNEAESTWSPWMEVVGPVALESFGSDLPSPRKALGQSIRWTAQFRGGIGELTYEFQTLKTEVIVAEQIGSESTWDWQPRKAGIYQVRVIARDEAGHRFESGWSPEYRILPAVSRDALLAFLPPENLSGVGAPLEEIGSAFAELLVRSGLRILDPEDLSAFMARNRWRHTGGISTDLARKLRHATGTEAVFITSVEAYQHSGPPRISLVSRLVLCGPEPQVLWIKSVGLTGADAPGLLGLGVVRDISVLIERAQKELLASLEQYFAGEERTQRLWYLPGDEGNAGKNSPDLSLDKKYRPRTGYRASHFEPAAPYAVAIVPFMNEYARKNAGHVLPLHLMEALHPYENLKVFEPGVIRDYLLKYRMVMPAGPSLAVSDILSSPTGIDADLVLSGQVFDYQGLEGTPKVDFSIQIFDGKKRDVVWWSHSYATGDEGVYFFNVGRLHSAQVLASRMTEAIGALLFDGAAH